MQVTTLTEADEKTEDVEEDAMDAILRETSGLHEKSQGRSCPGRIRRELPEVSKITKGHDQDVTLGALHRLWYWK